MSAIDDLFQLDLHGSFYCRRATCSNILILCLTLD